jgi:hypothetical protein
VGATTPYFCADTAFIASATAFSYDYFRKVDGCAPAFCSANRAPTRSECFKNLSAQFIMHCSCQRCWQPVAKEVLENLPTSFDDRALLVKSLQHDVKQRSTRLEYIRIKSCI